jgi:hypothetical protein
VGYATKELGEQWGRMSRQLEEIGKPLDRRLSDQAWSEVPRVFAG